MGVNLHKVELHFCACPKYCVYDFHILKSSYWEILYSAKFLRDKVFFANLAPRVFQISRIHIALVCATHNHTYIRTAD